MAISFIGMSGAGKSTWSLMLEKGGLTRYSCDDLIEKELAPELKRLGYRGIGGISRWLGQPYDKRYKKNSRRYLKLEGESLTRILNEIKKADHGDAVVDTTGSVIYMSPRLRDALKKTDHGHLSKNPRNNHWRNDREIVLRIPSRSSGAVHTSRCWGKNGIQL